VKNGLVESPHHDTPGGTIGAPGLPKLQKCITRAFLGMKHFSLAGRGQRELVKRVEADMSRQVTEYDARHP
jgi:hypothetical protein